MLMKVTCDYKCFFLKLLNFDRYAGRLKNNPFPTRVVIFKLNNRGNPGNEHVIVHLVAAGLFPDSRRDEEFIPDRLRVGPGGMGAALWAAHTFLGVCISFVAPKGAERGEEWGDGCLE